MSRARHFTAPRPPPLPQPHTTAQVWEARSIWDIFGCPILPEKTGLGGYLCQMLSSATQREPNVPPCVTCSPHIGVYMGTGPEALDFIVCRRVGSQLHSQKT